VPEEIEMLKKSLILIIFCFCTLSPIQITEAALPPLVGAAWELIKKIAEDTAIDVIQSFFREDVKPKEVAALRSRVSKLERQFYSFNTKGYSKPADFHSVEQTVSKLARIINAMESRLSSLEDRVTSLEKRVTALEQDIPFVKQALAQWGTRGSFSPLSTSNRSTSPEQAVKDYYFAINNHQYQIAWAKLSTRFKNQFSPDGFHGGYKRWWDGKVKWVDIGQARLVEQYGNEAVVFVQLSYRLKDGRDIIDKKPYIRLIFDQATGTWLFYDKGKNP
jgi:polyhydroxyalkanoate synthesis regulator phasin